MEDVEIRNILLTPYSTLLVFSDDNTHKFKNMYSVDQEILDIDITNSMEYTEYSFMNKVLVTSESVLKYLVLPKQNKMLEGPIKLDKVFAFTTDEVSKPTDGLKRYAVDVDGDGYKIIHKYLDCSSVEGFKSDEDFISSRMQAIYDYAQGNPLGTRELDIEPVQIENEKDGIEQNLNNIFTMVDNIIEYIENSKENNVEVRVYVDMTGGFRTIPMYLLFILNILEKRGIIIKKVYYAQMSSEEKGKQKIQKIQIDDLTQILKTQDFTNGIHEFIKFGSAQELSVFLKKDLEIDTREEHRGVIENFVNSVERFAEAITISNRTKFEESIDKIKDAWLELEKIDTSTYSQEGNEENISGNDIKSTENNEKINLLKIFEPRIHSEYKLVWDNPNHLSYIKWCLKHNFIQQALTLYIELVPEVLFKISDDNIDTDRQSMHIMEVLDEKNLKSSWGKSEYKFKYWLLNQYNASVDRIRSEQAKHEITPARKACKEFLVRFSQRTPNEWRHKPDLTIKEFFEKVKESFGEKIYENYVDKEESIDINFNFEDTSWKMSQLNQNKFEYNWNQLIQLFSNPQGLCNFCIDVLDSIIEIVEQDDWKKDEIKSVGEITKKLGELVNTSILPLSSNDEINNNKEDVNHYKIEEMDEFKKYKVPFGYGCLKSKIKEKLSLVIIENINKKMLENLLSTGMQDLNKLSINEYIDKMIIKNMSCAVECKKNIDYKGIIKEALGSLKTEIIQVRDGKESFKIRKSHIRVSDVKDDVLENILLPRNINKIEFSEFPELGNEIASMDKYSRVNDIENLIANNKINLDQRIISAFTENQEAFRVDAEKILELVESINGNNREKAEKILKQYLQIIPESIGGYAAPKDMWGRDTLTLLVLRILLYPYNILKLIRNNSVHAREERNLNVTREDIRRLIEKSIGTIEKYLDAVK